MRLSAVVVTVAASLYASNVVQAAEPEPAAVDRVIADALKAWNVPGVAVAVVRNDRVVVLKGYGRKQIDKPDLMTPDTVFPLASCSKAFTSTLIAMLVDDHKMTWDDRVRDHLPSFHLSDPHADAMVSLRDLLSHRTGISGNDMLWYRAPWSIDDVLGRVDKLPLGYPFRSGFDYNSIMYMAAGRAAASRSAQPWETLIKDRITTPLGMTGVTFTTSDIPANADRPTGHKRGKTGKIEVIPWYQMHEPNPAGSVNATARDLAAWLRFHLAGGVFNGKRLVSEKALRETHRPQNIIRLDGNARAMNPDTHQLSYGLGWVVADHRGKLVVAHGGQIDGFRVQITFLPDENVGFVLLNNLHETRMNQAVTNSLIDLYCGLPPRDWDSFFLKIVADADAARAAALSARDKARNPNTKPTLGLDRYAGEYENPAYGKAHVVVASGKLVLDWSSFHCKLEHFQDDVFRVTEGYHEEKLVEFAVRGKDALALRFLNVVFQRK